MDIKTKLENVIKGKIGAHTPGFSIIAAKEGVPFFKAAYGCADLETGDMIRCDDNFIIASNTKQITCLAILMLRERGLLDLDETIERFFPDFPDYRKKVTVRHLMCHTSGIKEYFDMKDEQLREKFKTVHTQEMTRLIRDFGDLEFAPDEKFSYCNSGYVMLGDIVRQLSGKLFGEFVETEIFRPLKMTRSYAPDDDRCPDRYQVKGYHSEDGIRFDHPPYDMFMVGYADGNVSSNTEDMLKWKNYLHGKSDELLSYTARQEMFKSHALADGTLTGYGLGLFLDERADSLSKHYPNHREIWHTGGTSGFISRCSYFPDDEITVNLLTNYEGLNQQEIFFAVLDEIFGEASGGEEEH